MRLFFITCEEPVLSLLKPWYVHRPRQILLRADRFSHYVGADVVQYDGFPACGEFQKIDLNIPRVDLTDEIADVVAAVETIEHLENPRAFVRELA
ncbi:MAG: hypothetical protein ACRERX_20810, partial [Pseudomonas sp.]